VVRDGGATNSYRRNVTLSPSSLIFVAIVAGWVVYLVPQWIRRREQLQASRTHDRHSRGTRVLEPRAARPHPDGASSAPIHRRPGDHDDAAGSPEGTSSQIGDHRDMNDQEESRADIPAGNRTRSRPGARSRPIARRRPAPLARAARRRLMGLIYLVVLAASSGVLAALPGVPSWVVLPAVGLLLLDVLAIVVTAPGRGRPGPVVGSPVRTLDEGDDLAEDDDEDDVSPARTPQWGRPARLVWAPPASRPATPSPAARETDLAESPVPGPRPGARPSQRPGAEAPGEAAVSGGGESSRAAGDVPAGTWTPVPVPRPTYALKPTAPRPSPAPLAAPEASVRLPQEQEAGPVAASVPAVSVPITHVPVVEPAPSKLDLDAVLERRRAANA